MYLYSRGIIYFIFLLFSCGTYMSHVIIFFFKYANLHKKYKHFDNFIFNTVSIILIKRNLIFKLYFS